MPNAILDVTYGASDIERASQFYDAALGALGIKRNPHAEEGWACWGPDYEADGVGFCICTPFNGKQCTAGNGTMVTFAAHSAEAVRAFHAAALANGGSDEGAPGTRAYYSPTFYVAYVRDPDGNKLAAAFYNYAAEESLAPQTTRNSQ